MQKIRLRIWLNNIPILMLIKYKKSFFPILLKKRIEQNDFKCRKEILVTFSEKAQDVRMDQSKYHRTPFTIIF